MVGRASPRPTAADDELPGALDRPADTVVIDLPASYRKQAKPSFEGKEGSAFPCSVIRDVLDETTPAPVRASRHRRAASLLAQAPEAAAAHHAAAGDWAKAAFRPGGAHPDLADLALLVREFLPASGPVQLTPMAYVRVVFCRRHS